MALAHRPNLAQTCKTSKTNLFSLANIRPAKPAVPLQTVPSQNQTIVVLNPSNRAFLERHA
jgi:hypothetical protein